jgi:hypothetical protein
LPSASASSSWSVMTMSNAKGFWSSKTATIHLITNVVQV